MQRRDGRRCPEAHNDSARNFASELQAENHDDERNSGEKCCAPIKRGERAAQRGHTMEEIARHCVHAETEQIADLRARDEDGNAVGETHDHRSREIFDGGTHAGRAKQKEQDAGHHRAHEQTTNAVLGDDSRDNHDERSGRASDLRFRTA